MTYFSRNPARTLGAGLVAACMMITPLVGCSSITESRPRSAENGRVLVTGTSPVPLRLVTSTNYFVEVDPLGEETIILVVADTVELPLPIDRTVPLRSSGRFYVALTNPSTTADANVALRVLIDGQQVFSQAATLRDASLVFSYVLF